MTYSEPTPEQETTGQDEAEETTEQQTTEQDVTEQSEEPGKNQGDPLFAETEDDQPDAGAGTATSASA